MDGLKMDNDCQLQSAKGTFTAKSPHEVRFDGHKEIDYFELFCLQAGQRRLSSSRDYGGSLPCIPPVRSKDAEQILSSSSPQSPLYPAVRGGVHLAVPTLPGMRRTHSDIVDPSCHSYAFPITPPTHRKSAPRRIWSSIKSLVDSCEGSPSCLSPSTSPPFERFSNEEDVARCVSAPHSRSSSIKRKRRPRPVNVSTVTTSITFDLADDLRPRPGSFPGQSPLRRPNHLTLDPNHNTAGSMDADDWQRVRHFVITPKGIVNCGDSFRSKSCSSSLRSLGSIGSGCLSGVGSQGSMGSLLSQEPGPPAYRVLILGAAGVGKTTLAQQFLTSECLVEKESLNEFEDCQTVTVLLDGEEAQLDIIEHSQEIKEDRTTTPMVDATLVVYSTIDRMTFQHANETLYNLRRENPQNDAIVLVANKTDLVRIRQVAEQEGKSTAGTFNCKYFEVSALMNLRVDELLAGVVNQIRLHRHSRQAPYPRRSPIPEGRKSPLRLINKLLRRQTHGSKSCDNLLVL